MHEDDVENMVANGFAENKLTCVTSAEFSEPAPDPGKVNYEVSWDPQCVSQ